MSTKSSPPHLSAVQPAKLSAILEAYAFRTELGFSVLDRNTGEVAYVSTDGLESYRDGDESYDHLPEWQRKDVELLRRLDHDQGLLVIDSLDSHEQWEIMRDYALSLDTAHADALLDAIGGRGAFRAFRSYVRRHGLEDAWYAFQGRREKELAIGWCERHGVVFVDDVDEQGRLAR